LPQAESPIYRQPHPALSVLMMMSAVENIFLEFSLVDSADLTSDRSVIRRFTGRRIPWCQLIAWLGENHSRIEGAPCWTRPPATSRATNMPQHQFAISRRTSGSSPVPSTNSSNRRTIYSRPSMSLAWKQFLMPWKGPSKSRTNRCS